MTCYLYENVTIKLLTPEFLFDYENLNPIFHENKLGGTLSLNEHTRVLISLKKKCLLRISAPGNCGFIMVSSYSRRMMLIYWKIITKLTFDQYRPNVYEREHIISHLHKLKITAHMWLQFINCLIKWKVNWTINSPAYMTLMIRCHGSPPLFTLFRPIAAHRTVSILEKKIVTCLATWPNSCMDNVTSNFLIILTSKTL